jgi:hypothetical protein
MTFKPSSSLGSIVKANPLDQDQNKVVGGSQNASRSCKWRPPNNTPKSVQLYGTTTLARHSNTLASLIAGIVQAKSCRLPAIARHALDASNVERRI